ncbi:MAG: HAD family hydrolase [Chloroflexota bacterium]
MRLLVVDVDGCLTPGEGRPLDLAVLRQIAQANRRAQGDGGPAVTLCTGRQEPYVEVLMQAIGGYLPAIYENGCGLYFPLEYRFQEHPAITAAMRHALAETRSLLQERAVATGKGYFQPGKECSLSLYPLPGTTVHDLRLLVEEALSARPTGYQVQGAVSSVDVVPQGMDKGEGVRWLARETGIPLAEMAGLGDSPSDLAFLSLVGFSAAPANAAAEVKARVHYVSPYAHGRGVLDVLRRMQGLQ